MISFGKKYAPEEEFCAQTRLDVGSAYNNTSMLAGKKTIFVQLYTISALYTYTIEYTVSCRVSRKPLRIGVLTWKEMSTTVEAPSVSLSLPMSTE